MADDNEHWILVVAIARNGVIGRENSLPWKLSRDLQRFKAMTMGHCLLMGRKTYQSIGRPLPGRQTIVVSRTGYDPGDSAITVIPDVAQVAEHVQPGRRVMVVGGAQLYAAALPRCGTMWITRVEVDIAGDTFFPELDWSQWQLQSSESFTADANNQWPSEFQVWRRATND